MYIENHGYIQILKYNNVLLIILMWLRKRERVGERDR